MAEGKGKVGATHGHSTPISMPSAVKETKVKPFAKEKKREYKKLNPENRKKHKASHIDMAAANLVSGGPPEHMPSSAPIIADKTAHPFWADVEMHTKEPTEEDTARLATFARDVMQLDEELRDVPSRGPIFSNMWAEEDFVAAHSDPASMAHSDHSAHSAHSSHSSAPVGTQPLSPESLPVGATFSVL